MPPPGGILFCHRLHGFTQMKNINHIRGNRCNLSIITLVACEFATEVRFARMENIKRICGNLFNLWRLLWRLCRILLTKFFVSAFHKKML